MCVAFLSIANYFFLGYGGAGMLFAEAFLVEVGKREKWRDEANEGCSAQEQITARFSSLARNC